MKHFQASDLFAGAGGFSAGLIDACHSNNRSLELMAINHWPAAIATHRLNHPEVSHLCENLDNVDPRKVHPGGRLDLLIGSPECVHFSNARGGRPMSDQSRASAWHIVRWCEALRIGHVIIENVKEFRTWGPLDAKGRPIPHRKGELFRAWLQCFEALGYYVDHRVLNAADYGAATSRQRLFIQACRRRKPTWPEQTHSSKPDLMGSLPHRAAREVIDWDLKGKSIFDRKKPLADKTLRRIEAGLRKFSGAEFVLGQQSCAAPREVGQPLPTVAGAGAISLIQPLLVVLRNHGEGRDVDRPLPTLCASGGYVGLCEPFIVPFRSEREGQETRCHSIDKPLPTLTAGANGFALAEPFLVPYYGSSGAASCGSPLPTVTAHDRFGLCEPEPVAIFERDGVTYALVDVRFRMLQLHELAAGMGLDGYQFTGTKTDGVKMVGNAVERNVAKALCGMALQ